jgi:thiol-disulfide isomerase/thioredoxin
MAGTSQGRGGGKTGKVPPRPGSSRPSVPKRPAGKPVTYGPPRGGRPVPRASARQSLQQRRQRNIYTALAVIGVVVVVVAVIITVSLTGGGTKNPTAGKVSSGAFAISPSLVAQVEGVPVDKLVAAAKPLPDTAVPSQALPAKNPVYTQGGKPAVVYVGAEYCPYCAAERWPLVVALSKFGTFSGLTGTTSSATDTNPSTPTFSFYGSTYTSKYLTFNSDEEETSSGTALQAPTAAEQALVTKWDTTPYIPAADQGQNPIPFIFLGGKYLLTGTQYDASPLSGKQWDAAARYITSGTNATSKAVEAAAGYLIGDLCVLTHNQPAAVCSQVPAVLKGITTSSPRNQGSSVPSTTAQSSSTTGKSSSTTGKSSSTTAKSSSTTAKSPTTTAKKA